MVVVGVVVVGVGVGVVSEAVARLRGLPASKKPVQVSARATAVRRAMLFMASQWCEYRQGRDRHERNDRRLAPNARGRYALSWTAERAM